MAHHRDLKTVREKLGYVSDAMCHLKQAEMCINGAQHDSRKQELLSKLGKSQMLVYLDFCKLMKEFDPQYFMVPDVQEEEEERQSSFLGSAVDWCKRELWGRRDFFLRITVLLVALKIEGFDLVDLL